MDSKYVSSAELAQHFAVSVPTVRQWMRQNKIPPNLYIKVGTAYRFLLTDIEQHFFDENARRLEAKFGPKPQTTSESAASMPTEEVSSESEEEQEELFDYDSDDDV
jgi:predicted DNA-binding transcriptional regulator AlpA